jgi:hypothetical protein
LVYYNVYIAIHDIYIAVCAVYMRLPKVRVKPSILSNAISLVQVCRQLALLKPALAEPQGLPPPSPPSLLFCLSCTRIVRAQSHTSIQTPCQHLPYSLYSQACAGCTPRFPARLPQLCIYRIRLQSKGPQKLPAGQDMYD